MEPIVLVALFLLGLAIVAAVWVFADGPRSLPEMFRYQHLGWPRGVQEDDDTQWRWRRPPGPTGPPMERLRGEVHAGRPTPPPTSRVRR